MKALREVLVLLVVAVAPAVLAVAFHPQLADRRRSGLEPGAVRLAEVRDWHADVLWIDARGAADFARNHIPGAIRFDEADFDRGIGDVLTAWTPGRRIVVYCSSTNCGTSRELAERLRTAGFSEVFHLHGGWDAWLAATKK